eukprot:7777692-Karenia_brevis.AAC.1
MLGWVHSHHYLQGVPSVIDVRAHASQQAAGGFPLLAIFVQESRYEPRTGLRVWELSEELQEP